MFSLIYTSLVQALLLFKLKSSSFTAKLKEKKNNNKQTSKNEAQNSFIDFVKLKVKSAKKLSADIKTGALTPQLLSLLVSS